MNDNVAQLFENLWDSLYIVDKSKTIVHWNKSAEELTGYTVGDVLGRQCGEDLLSHHCDSKILCRLGCPLQETLKDGEVREAQVSLLNKNGVSVPVFLRTLPCRNGQGEIIGAMEVFRKLGVTDEVSDLLHELNNLAYVEPLTRAARRNYGEAMLDKALDAFHASSASFGVLLIDLDHFKQINDRLGHAAGDRVLVEVTSMIRLNLRAADLLVRWGGDEFLVIVVGTNAAALTGIGNKLCELARNIRIEHDGRPVDVTLSIGGALPRPGETRAELLERADKALYRSKQCGRNCCTPVSI